MATTQATPEDVRGQTSGLRFQEGRWAILVVVALLIACGTGDVNSPSPQLNAQNRGGQYGVSAMTLDFPSGSAFRNTCQRYLGATPQDVRARGGADYVVGAFLRTIGHGAREADHPRAAPRSWNLAV
jgi:hypothetical protein